MTLRLARTTREVEGHVMESWALLDSEDELETWPANEQLALVGRGAPRLDGVACVTGSARYTVDVVLPGMLHALTLVSPLPRARLASLDVAAAAAVSGVWAVVGPESVLPMPLESGRPAGVPILGEQVEYAGQPVAAVAADSLEAAADGLQALAPVWEPLPFVVDLDEAVREQLFTAEPTEKLRGDSERGLAEADVRVELTVETPGVLQVPLEPHAAVAEWRPEGLTVWLSTQGMFAARNELAKIFGLPLERVRVISEFVGGGFGAKSGAGSDSVLATELSRRTGRPVRLVGTRHIEVLDGGRRSATRQTVRLGARRDGTLTAIETDVLVGSGQPGFLVNMLAVRVAHPAMTLYRCENVTGQVFPLRLNLRGTNAFRAPGLTEGTTVFEQAIDELAVALELDPLELRRRLHTDVDQSNGKPYSADSLLECYERAAALAGWGERERLRERQPDGLLRGLGCASVAFSGAGAPPAQVRVRIAANGVATVITGIQDTGTGTTTAAQLVAAEELGLPLESVRVLAGDTSHGLFGPNSGGSFVVPTVMPAVRSAAAKARRLLLELAADLLEISSEDLLLADGRVRSRDRVLDVPVTEVTQRLQQSVLEASGSRGLNAEDVEVQSFGCQIAQVAVDPGVGLVFVEQIWAVHDVGRIINLLGATSQVEGGILQGLGYALTEEQVVDQGSGIPANGWLDDYKLPTIADTPEITVEFLDRPDESVSNVGAKGLGEPPIVPTAAAIANAFAHATGRRAGALPLTRQRVIETLR